jgi:hypothetical protein
MNSSYLFIAFSVSIALIFIPFIFRATQAYALLMQEIPPGGGGVSYARRTLDACGLHHIQLDCNPNVIDIRSDYRKGVLYIPLNSEETLYGLSSILYEVGKLAIYHQSLVKKQLAQVIRILAFISGILLPVVVTATLQGMLDSSSDAAGWVTPLYWMTPIIGVINHTSCLTTASVESTMLVKLKNHLTSLDLATPTENFMAAISYQSHGYATGMAWFVLCIVRAVKRLTSERRSL